VIVRWLDRLDVLDLARLVQDVRDRYEGVRSSIASTTSSSAATTMSPTPLGLRLVGGERRKLPSS
jgi:hypothetical protein